MVKFLALLLLTFGVGAMVGHARTPGILIANPTFERQPATAQSMPSYQPGKDSALLIDLQSGGCSGFVFRDHHTFITAQHCLTLGGAVVAVNHVKMRADIEALDGHDHVIMHVDAYLPGRPAKIVPFPPAGTPVYIWGNPSDFEGLLRMGHVAGRLMYEGTYYDVIDINTWHGDSGGAFFDERGNVVAIVEGSFAETVKDEGAWRMTTVQPFTFTPEQLKGHA